MADQRAVAAASQQDQPECSICMQEFMYPCELPCGHVFCYLCIKGFLTPQSSRCALCRSEVDRAYLNSPCLVQIEKKLVAERPAALVKREQDNDDDDDEDDEAEHHHHHHHQQSQRRHVWYYEGRNGWWEYDERTNAEIESAYKRDRQHQDATTPPFQVLICGVMYNIDFENKIQMRVDDPTKKRRIKRDGVSQETRKGVAGILMPTPRS